MAFSPILIEADPAIRTFEDVLYLPFQGDASNPRRWGVYQQGNLILDTAALRGGSPKQQELIVQEPAVIERKAQTYVYGGLMHPHFGHLLLTSLSRYWTVRPGFKYLVNGNITPKVWFNQPAIGECLRALNLSEDDFVVLNEPTMLGQLIVPAPSLIEEWSVHRVFGRLGARIGEKLAPDAASVSDRPVYLTKLQHKSGVWRFENEADMVERLEQAGVEIVAPETLPLGDQIRLIQSRPIISPMGSAHHLSIFASTGCRLTILTHTQDVQPNFPLVDCVRGNHSQYVAAPGGASYRHDDPAFHSVVRLNDPAGCAEALLRTIDGASSQSRRFVKHAASEKLGTFLSSFWKSPKTRQ
jgi:hypothetical protein